MERRQRHLQKSVTTPSRVAARPISRDFGVSFSLKQCRNFKLDAYQTLQWLIESAGFRRFRLMSYWNEHEKQPGAYDFTQLDWQMDMAAKHGCEVTLCLGARQPRWPENHWPQWAWEADFATRSTALLTYIKTVVQRYKNHPALTSYQLENEALLKAFGERPEVSRKRLRDEFALVKRLDSDHPVAMSTSTSWGIPLRRPIPDMVGFSYYQLFYAAKDQSYHTAFHTPRLHRWRRRFIRLATKRPTFIHELQLEPWGPTAIWKMDSAEQDKSMGPAQIAKNVQLAKAVQASPIDLWGGEWWYWRLKQGDPSIWEAVKAAIR